MLLHLFHFQSFQPFELLVLHLEGLLDAHEERLEVLLLGDLYQKPILGHRLQRYIDVKHLFVILIRFANVYHQLVILVQGQVTNTPIILPHRLFGVLLFDKLCSYLVRHS